MTWLKRVHTHCAPAEVLEDALVADNLADEGIGVGHDPAIIGCGPPQVDEFEGFA